MCADRLWNLWNTRIIAQSYPSSVRLKLCEEVILLYLQESLPDQIHQMVHRREGDRDKYKVNRTILVVHAASKESRSRLAECYRRKVSGFR